MDSKPGPAGDWTEGSPEVSLAEFLRAREAVHKIAFGPHVFGTLPSPEEVAAQSAARPVLATEAALVGAALALGADGFGDLTASEARLAASAKAQPAALVADLRARILAGDDPLGETFCALRSAEVRRERGAVYTPAAIVRAMVEWAATIGTPERVVDPGAGSGRFLVEAGRRFAGANLVAVETDPLAALTTRAHLSAAGLATRAVVMLDDFRSARFEKIQGRTLYLGNPPYVRHHLIGPEWKEWLKHEAAARGLKASTLAGLHVYFFLAIARFAKAGDYGALITAAEWLDVNYGQLVRSLFLDRLGGQAVYVIEPDAQPFPGTQSTAAVTSFKVNGVPPSARFARIDRLTDLDHLAGGRPVRRERLLAEPRWSHFTRKHQEIPVGYVELGELCRVHRGQVTGANKIWIAGPHSEGLPEEFLFPTVTKARELIRAGETLADPAALRRVIDLPTELDVVSGKKRDAVQAFLRRAEEMGGKDSYIATHRKAWWAVGLKKPAPVLATYMARRPPAFVLNEASARHINIAHGLYPREPLTSKALVGLVRYLRSSATTKGGRVYAGGLTKFEPREMERIPVPDLATLADLGA